MQQAQSQRDYWSGKVGDDWALFAERIDAMLAPITAAALEDAAFKTGERVLDVGCGSGATSLQIAASVGPTGHVAGVDLSPQMLEVARKRASQAGLNVEFLEADAGSAELGDRFDAVFSRFGVMFFDTPTKAFSHIHAHMSDKGRLRFACWRAMAENIWATTPLDAIRELLKTPLPPPDPDAPGPYSLAAETTVQRVLQDAGWRDIALSRWDGLMKIGGGGGLDDAASFMLKIGPCARAIAEHGLDAARAKQLLMDRLAPHQRDDGVALPGACWLVAASA